MTDFSSQGLVLHDRQIHLRRGAGVWAIFMIHPFWMERIWGFRKSNQHQRTSTNINEHQRTSTNINQHQLTSKLDFSSPKKKWNWGFSPQKGYCHQKPSGFGGSTNLRWSQPGLPQKVILCYKTVSPKIQQLGGAGSTWLVVDICWHPLPAFFA